MSQKRVWIADIDLACIDIRWLKLWAWMRWPGEEAEDRGQLRAELPGWGLEEEHVIETGKESREGGFRKKIYAYFYMKKESVMLEVAQSLINKWKVSLNLIANSSGNYMREASSPPCQLQISSKFVPHVLISIKSVFFFFFLPTHTHPGDWIWNDNTYPPTAGENWKNTWLTTKINDE